MIKHMCRWVNYDECEGHMQSALNTRGLKETVHTFKSRQYPLLSAVKFWSENVKLVIGMHGGALYNVMWLSPGSSVIELRPRYNNNTYGGTIFWELTSLKNMSYWTIPVDAINPKYDAIIDCGMIAHAMMTALDDNFDPRGSPLDAWYQGRFQPGF